MPSSSRRSTPFLILLLVTGITIATASCTGQKAKPAQPSIPSTSASLQSAPCAGPVCASLIVTQSGRPGKVDLSAQGILPSASFALPAGQVKNSRFVIDTGLPSPDGKWVAYTTVGNETGGPVLLQNLSTGAWTNLIQAMNAHLPGGQPLLREDDLWDVIGWFPDSARLMIGPVDRSQLLIIDLATFNARQVLFPGGGRGGRLFVNLTPDGRGFIFIGEDSAGSQVLSAYDLSTGQEITLLKQSYEQGALYNPRFAPNQKSVAYLVQKGQPSTGLSYSINLLSSGKGQVAVLVDGNLGITIPTWSPDGRYIAYTRNKDTQPSVVAQGAVPTIENSSVWIVSVADGKQSQVTFIDGQARNPVWAKDSQTLAFVSGDGQVQMANITRPGILWQAAGPSQNPELTSAFFLP